MGEGKQREWITEGLIIALIPILGYFYAFQYEVGYASYFKYPQELIIIGLPQIVIATMSLWVGIIMIFMFVESITMMIPRAQRGLTDSIIKFLPLVGFFVGSLFIYGWKYAWIFLVVFLLIGISEFILPLFTAKDKKSYSEKIEASWDDEWRLREAKDTISWRLTKFIGHKNVVFVINIFIVAQLIQVFGEVVASRQVKFFTISGSPERAILRIYDDRFICAGFDRKTKIVNGDISVINPKDQSMASLKLESIGPLITDRLDNKK